MFYQFYISFLSHVCVVNPWRKLKEKYLVFNPSRSYVCTHVQYTQIRARICKRLRSPGIDSAMPHRLAESIPGLLAETDGLCTVDVPIWALSVQNCIM